MLITGAGRGIGQAIAAAFAARGAIIAANDITPINLDETVKRITEQGGRARDYVFDVAKKMPVQAMIEQVRADWEGIDILINCAVVKPRAPILEMDEWDWRRTLDVNLTGAFFTMQSVGRVMRLQGQGGIMINLAASLDEVDGLQERAAYIASKMGLIGLTRVAAREFANDRIRVNVVCPEWTTTEIDPLRMPNGYANRELDISFGQAGKPVGIVDLVLFLCSEAGADITGQDIHINGRMVNP